MMALLHARGSGAWIVITWKDCRRKFVGASRHRTEIFWRDWKQQRWTSVGISEILECSSLKQSAVLTIRSRRAVSLTSGPLCPTCAWSAGWKITLRGHVAYPLSLPRGTARTPASRCTEQARAFPPQPAGKSLARSCRTTSYDSVLASSLASSDPTVRFIQPLQYACIFGFIVYG